MCFSNVRGWDAGWTRVVSPTAAARLVGSLWGCASPGRGDGSPVPRCSQKAPPCLWSLGHTCVRGGRAEFTRKPKRIVQHMFPRTLQLDSQEWRSGEHAGVRPAPCACGGDGTPFCSVREPRSPQTGFQERLRGARGLVLSIQLDVGLGGAREVGGGTWDLLPGFVQVSCASC